MDVQFIYWIFSITIVFPSTLFGITTIHHDKPESARIAKMANKMKQELVVSSTTISVPFNLTALNMERQKRLLPYVNYYLKPNNNHQTTATLHYKQQSYLTPSSSSVANQNYAPQPIQSPTVLVDRDKFTPFLDSNALPGPFTPILKQHIPHKANLQFIDGPTTIKPITSPYIPEAKSEIDKIPNYSAIYDKLSQLKLVQDSNRYIQQQQQQSYETEPVIVPQKHTINYVPATNYNNQHYYKIMEPSKTIIETYTPTNIDLTVNDNQRYNQNQNRYKGHLIYKIVQSQPQQAVSKPRPIFIVDNHFNDRKPFIIYHHPKINPQNIKSNAEPPLAPHEETGPPPSPSLPLEEPQVVIDDNYVAQKIVPVSNYQEVYYQTSPVPITSFHKPTENTNTLSKILKQLQDSNALPHTLTPENIDNSIKTLVKILNALKKHQPIKPIIVSEEITPEPVQQDHYESVPQIEHHEEEVIPGTTIQNFPANTIDGGTPGRPGIDYPALSSIPQTDFNCKTQRYKGFFGDPNTNCQVWHYCDLNGGQASFLCPNGTIFSQVALTCDWWYNVKCSSTAQLYVLNERLYKYILPLAPKFPEDYSGPLVDKYLALKFQEMEEKMKKERKKKPKNEDDEEEVEDKDDSDQLREIQAEQTEKSLEAT